MAIYSIACLLLVVLALLLEQFVCYWSSNGQIAYITCFGNTWCFTSENCQFHIVIGGKTAFSCYFIGTFCFSDQFQVKIGCRHLPTGEVNLSSFYKQIHSLECTKLLTDIFTVILNQSKYSCTIVAQSTLLQVQISDITCVLYDLSRRSQFTPGEGLLSIVS